MSDGVERLVGVLAECAAEKCAFEYATGSLEVTLQDIGFSCDFVHGLCDLLGRLRHTGSLAAPAFLSRCSQFVERWYDTLVEVYGIHYEAHRFDFFRDHLFADLGRAGRVLDLGCGRGLLGPWLLRQGLADTVTGIDVADFRESWDILRAEHPELVSRLQYATVPVSQRRGWLARQEAFDTVVLLWVLHHSSLEEGTATLEDLRVAQSRDTRVLVLEDTHIPDSRAHADPFGFDPRWRDLCRRLHADGQSAAWRTHCLLDFVAVRVLARYENVQMALTHRTGDEWSALLKRCGFVQEGAKYIGFPAKRDIAVPQSLFTVRCGVAPGD